MSKKKTPSNQIIRPPDFAGGWITADEKARWDAHAELWISREMRTSPIDPAAITPAIRGLYEVAGLKPPRAVIVPSPLVMALAGGFASAIWHTRKHNAATRAATRDHTYDATRPTAAATNAAAPPTH